MTIAFKQGMNYCTNCRCTRSSWRCRTASSVKRSSELEEARDRYANLYDFAPVGYLTLDDNGDVLEINLTGAGMLGVERLNIVGKPLDHPSDHRQHTAFHCAFTPELFRCRETV